MTDKMTDSSYEAAHEANKELGEIKLPTGEALLSTDAGTRVLNKYEEARGAFEDPLTGLLNRGGWEPQMVKQFEGAKRYGGKFTIVIMDVDKFKEINDQGGHQEGDKVLKKIGSQIKEDFRESDIKGRYGGDEFIVMLPKSNFLENQIKAERDKITSRLMEATGVGISVGMYQWNGEGSLEDAIRKADGDLYRAKADKKADKINV